MTHFAVYDNQAVWGIGRNVNEAWEDARDWSEGPLEGMQCAPCTTALFDHVLNHGGDVAVSLKGSVLDIENAARGLVRH